MRRLLLSIILALPLLAQEQVDQPDKARPALNVSQLLLRVRVTRVAPDQKTLTVQWRHGGEGLGGNVTRGAFTSDEGQPALAIAQWSKPLPLTQVSGKSGYAFPTIVVGPIAGKKPVNNLTDVAVDFEFIENGQTIKSFSEAAPKGATVSIAVPLNAPDRDTFLAGLLPVSQHAKQRRQRLEQLFPQPFDPPRLFGVIGHLAGYGEGSGYGIRHSNPEIVKDECATLRMLGVNGMVGEKSVNLADAAGAGQFFRHDYWGGPGSGSPMNMLKKRADDPVETCPYDPQLAPRMSESVKKALEEHARVKAQRSWALWWDEIGVAAKAHIETCPRCRDKYVEYVKKNGVSANDLAAEKWEEVKPYPVWTGKAPTDRVGGLNYYYTSRFMTESTAQLFPEAARALREHNVLLYAMQGPTPSWAGHSLDWHEFYDRGPNTALVFETSNRDPRAWQFESYLADIARGICDRHQLPMGVLVKPHRGAVAQRMLSVVSRGASVIEWYTYGPDYAKGDSFSQSPELLEKVANAARFLSANETRLYGAKPALPAQVAFCSPRSSEIWGRTGELGVTAFEDAKWVYIALRHANVPLDILSEQQLAEGKLDQYKVLYVVGPNLRRDAGAAVAKWVEAGGILWTDAMGLSRDEANQPAHEGLTGLKDRRLQLWGTVPPYKATALQPFVEKDIPADVDIVERTGQRRPIAVGRELIEPNQKLQEFALFADKRWAGAWNTVGKGRVYLAAPFAGLTYSAAVRRPDFDMSRDFEARHATLITFPIFNEVLLPVTLSVPVVEAVALRNDKGRSIALMNWGYKRTAAKGETFLPVENLRITLRGLGNITTVRSATRGNLPVESAEAGVYVVSLPALDEIDLLLLD